MEQIEQVTNWLHQQINRTLLLTKQEDGDLDQVSLKLNKVSMGDLGRIDPDDYVSRHALLLHGEGTIQSKEQTASLPLDAYEIPLTDDLIVDQESEKLKIKTERATYEIQRLH